MKNVRWPVVTYRIFLSSFVIGAIFNISYFTMYVTIIMFFEQKENIVNDLDPLFLSVVFYLLFFSLMAVSSIFLMNKIVEVEFGDSYLSRVNLSIRVAHILSALCFSIFLFIILNEVFMGGDVPSYVLVILSPSAGIAASMLRIRLQS